MENYEWLKYHTKCFPCNGTNIEIINTPAEFYETLKKKIKYSKNRIIWSSLYFGTGKLEKELVELLLERCQMNRLDKTRPFTFLCLIDYLRGSRPVHNIHRPKASSTYKNKDGGNYDPTDLYNPPQKAHPKKPAVDLRHDRSDPANLPESRDVVRIPPKFVVTADTGTTNADEEKAKMARYSSVVVTFPSLLSNKTITSRDMLLPLIKRYPENASVYLYQSPKFNRLKKLLLPGALREIAGLNHVKAYIFDDNVIISGANLSETYFTDRQDRYILIRDCKDLCDYLEIFIRLLCKLSSYRLLPDDTTFDMIKLSRQISKRRKKSLKAQLAASSDEEFDENVDDGSDGPDDVLRSSSHSRFQNNLITTADQTGDASTTASEDLMRSRKYALEENQYYMKYYYGKSGELGFKIRQLFGGYKYEKWIRSELAGQRRSSQSSKEFNRNHHNSWKDGILPFLRRARKSSAENDGLEDYLLAKTSHYGSIASKTNPTFKDSASINNGPLPHLHKRSSSKTHKDSINTAINNSKVNDSSDYNNKRLTLNDTKSLASTSDKTNYSISSPPPISPKYDTFIYPLIQARPHGVNVDHSCMLNFLKSIEGGSRLWLASGYFNLVPAYTDILLNKNKLFKDKEDDNFTKYRDKLQKSLLNQGQGVPSHGKALYAANILLASPQANGFYGAHGFKKYVPLIYVYATHLFFDKMTHQKADIPKSKSFFHRMFYPYRKDEHSDSFTADKLVNQHVSLWEYQREGWTFHSKGLWLYSPFGRYPNFTIFGSSNFGYRSVYRDVELQMAMYTTNETLKQKLHNELNDVLGYTTQINEHSFEGADRRVPLWLKIVFKLMRPYF